MFRSVMMIAIVMLGSLQTLPSEGPMARSEERTEGPLAYDIEIENLTISENETVIWSNLTVLVSGLLRINGTLELMNTTVHLDNGSIECSGNLSATDLDGNGATDDDMCRLIGHGLDQATVGGGSWFFNISSSYLENLLISPENLTLKDSILVNCTLHVGSDTRISDLDISGPKEGCAILLTEDPPELESIRVSDCMEAIRSNGWELDLTDVEVSRCSRGLIDPQEGPISLVRCNFEDNSVNLDVSGGLVAVSCFFTNGSLELNRGDLVLQECVFRTTTGIRNASGGLVRSCSFDRCSPALSSPSELRISRNDFVRCSVGMEGPIDCLIYHNSFQECSRITTGTVASLWYNETLEEGNHYSNYEGLDNGEGGRRAFDGIGDTMIPYIQRDLYPLMADDHWLMPDIPTIFAEGLLGSDLVSVTWIGTGGDGYILQRAMDPDFSEMVTTWSLTNTSMMVDDNLNGSVFFRVRAYNPYGSKGWSLPAQAHVDMRPLPPYDIEVVPVSEGGGLTVSWKWRGEDIVNATLLYGELGQGVKVKTIPYPTTSNRIVGLNNGISYGINLISEDAAGQRSVPSDTVIGVPVDSVPPPPPRNVEARPLTNRSVILTWEPPLTQDISGYRILRSPDPNGPFDLLVTLSKDYITYEDRNLEDNTTYHYGVEAVDDDGPISGMGGPASVTTLHSNQPPIFTGTDLIIRTVEDSGPVSLDLSDDFEDPDGQTLVISVVESFPFNAEVADGVLWVIPSEDQAGEGYVQIEVTDGETPVFFLIGVIVEAVQDPPRDVSIESPLNGSVHMPGQMVLLRADYIDPDLDHGDSVNVTWSSDLDGILHRSTSSGRRVQVSLSPGIHNINIFVEDSYGENDTDTVTIVVSLWGWGSIPWRVDRVSSGLELGDKDGQVMVTIVNRGPLILSFMIQGSLVALEDRTDNPLRLDARTLLVEPGSEGSVQIGIPKGIGTEKDLLLLLNVSASTLNSTFAGTKTSEWQLEVAIQDDEGGGADPFLWVIGTITLLMLVTLATYMITGYLRSRNKWYSKR